MITWSACDYNTTAT